MQLVTDAIVPIVLLILVGAALKAYVIPSPDSWRAMGALAYNVAFPALLLGGLEHTTFTGLHVKFALFAVLAATLIIAALTLGLRHFTGMDGRKFSSFFQGAIRFNSYVYLALAQSLYGSHGVAIASCFIAVMIIVTNCLSVLALDRYGIGEKRNLFGTFLETLRNPLIQSAVVGFLLGAFHIVLPTLLDRTLLQIGAMASPLSLIAVGAGIRNVSQSLRSRTVLAACGLKLVALPILTFALCVVLGVAGPTRNLAVLFASLPVAGNAYILAEQMGGDTDIMAAIISLSVILCAAPLSVIFTRLV